MPKPQLSQYGKWKQGEFDVSKSTKFRRTSESTKAVYRSSYEWLFMKWCELTDDVVSWSSEPFAIPYTTLDGKKRNYWVDFTVQTTAQTLWVEVKPSKEIDNVNKFIAKYTNANHSAKVILILKYKTEATNYAKWNAAKSAAAAHGAKFVVISEKTLKR